MDDDLRQLAVLTVAAALLSGTAATAQAPGCEPGWEAAFGQSPGVQELGGFDEGWIWSVHDADLGSGPRLFVGGTFDRAGGIASENIAAWDGEAWFGRGARTARSTPCSPTTSAPAGCWWPAAPSTPSAASRCTAWPPADGAAWSPVGSSGLSLGVSVMHGVSAPELGGPGLLLGGSFGSLDGSPDSHLALWRTCPVQPQGTWTDLGHALAGSLGEPQLQGSGALQLAGTWPAGLPPGFALHLQAWIEDPGGPFGFAASNALAALAP